MPAFESNWYDDTNKKKLFWILQVSGWTSLALLAVNVLRQDAKVLLPLIVGRSMFGLIVSSFVMRPFARWARRSAARRAPP